MITVMAELTAEVLNQIILRWGHKSNVAITQKTRLKNTLVQECGLGQ